MRLCSDGEVRRRYTTTRPYYKRLNLIGGDSKQFREEAGLGFPEPALIRLDLADLISAL